MSGEACGATNGGKCCGGGQCCSQWGWCGATEGEKIVMYEFGQQMAANAHAGLLLTTV